MLICVIATKSVGGAVDRNRAKRCIRAAVDSFSVRISTDAKMILVARKAVLSASADEINHALEKLLKKAACLAS